LETKSLVFSILISVLGICHRLKKHSIMKVTHIPCKHNIHQYLLYTVKIIKKVQYYIICMYVQYSKRFEIK
jgi:hypothetical protein